MTVYFVSDSDSHDYFTVENLLAALANGQLIHAIRITRDLSDVGTRLGLKEAKDLVEAAMKGGKVYYDEREQHHTESSYSDYRAGTFVIVSVLTPVFESQHDAENEARTHTHVGNQYVARVVSKTEVTVKVTPID